MSMVIRHMLSLVLLLVVCGVGVECGLIFLYETENCIGKERLLLDVPAGMRQTAYHTPQSH